MKHFEGDSQEWQPIISDHILKHNTLSTDGIELSCLWLMPEIKSKHGSIRANWSRGVTNIKGKWKYSHFRTRLSSFECGVRIRKIQYYSSIKISNRCSCLRWTLEFSVASVRHVEVAILDLSRHTRHWK